MNLETIIKHRKNNQVLFMKSFIKDENLPNWEIALRHIHDNIDIIQKYLTQSADMGYPIEKTNSVIIPGAMNKNYYPNFDNLKKQINSLYPNDIQAMMTFISFKERFQKHVHQDHYDNFYIQCIGKSLWRLWNEDTSEIVEQYELEPGDVIFVPKLRHHDVISLSARMGIAMVFETI